MSLHLRLGGCRARSVLRARVHPFYRALLYSLCPGDTVISVAQMRTLSLRDLSCSFAQWLGGIQEPKVWPFFL